MASGVGAAAGFSSAPGAGSAAGGAAAAALDAAGALADVAAGSGAIDADREHAAVPTDTAARAAKRTSNESGFVMVDEF